MKTNLELIEMVGFVMERKSVLLTNFEVMRVVNGYIGVEGGYLTGFSYRTHSEFYPMYCGLDINPNQYSGTTWERFMTILSSADSPTQAKVLRGVLGYCPADNEFHAERRQKHKLKIEEMIRRLEGEVLPVVENPNLAITSGVIERAIADAKTLIENTGATSAVDRVHTLLHGYLKELCRQNGIVVNDDANVTALFSQLRSNHPAFQNAGNNSPNVDRMIRSLGAILDVFNPIRNRESMSHPNEVLLDEPEAILFINIARSVLQYINTKV
jgi:hypothetical protein